MKSFTVNNKKYVAKDFTYNVVCDLEDFGVSLSDFKAKPMSVIRAYLAVCADKDMEFAGDEIQAHVIAGGNFEEMMNCMSAKMDESDFFRALQSRTEDNPTEGTETESKAKK